jgi:hypothetical protein
MPGRLDAYHIRSIFPHEFLRPGRILAIATIDHDGLKQYAHLWGRLDQLKCHLQLRTKCRIRFAFELPPCGCVQFGMEWSG